MWLVVGLGNPDAEYQHNRHNIGFMVADELARRAKASWRSKFGGELATADGMTLLKPMKYMNVSGEVVQPAAAFLKIEPTNIVVVHDELDIEFPRIQVKVGGGTAGHNGLKSIAQRLGTQDFIRVRVSISRPDPRWDPADYVLSDFTKVEQKELPFSIVDAADAVETIVKQGTTAAMNRFNRKKQDSLPPER